MENWLAAAAAGVLALFGASTTGDHKPPRPLNGQASTTKQLRIQNVDIQCLAQAVAAREASLATGEQTLTAAINSAYATRASALASAYTQTGNDAIKSAVKAAWKQFTNSMQGAKKAWQKSRENAWQTFRTAIKSCGPNATSLADSGNAGSEMAGQ